MIALILGDAVDPGNVRMIEGRKDVRLALEAGTPVGVARDRVRQDLESHLPLQLQVAGAIDLAHSARPERCQNLICAKRGAGVERHRRGAIISASLHVVPVRRSGLGRFREDGPFRYSFRKGERRLVPVRGYAKGWTLKFGGIA